MIYIDSRKKSQKTLEKLHPYALLIDVTSKSDSQWVKLSPFYPHGGIPVPNSEGLTASCVEAIWQGLKVFQYADIDTSLFYNDTMKNLKRTVKRYGLPKGHRYGVNSNELLSYIDARKKIYIPSYYWILRNKVYSMVLNLVELAKSKDIVLLDYETNCEIEDGSKPLSHAYLIKKFIEENFQVKKPEYKQLSLF